MKILNLGSRNTLMKDAINIDSYDMEFIPSEKFINANVLDIDRFFESGSVDRIYSHHLFEHLTHQQIGNLLYKCWNILRSDGMIEITVPDFYELLMAYKKLHELGRFDTLDVMNIKFFDVAEETTHKSIWYKEIGVYYLEREGFFKTIDVQHTGVGDSQCPSDIQITFTAKKLV